jgi:hypothetical protein
MFFFFFFFFCPGAQQSRAPALVQLVSNCVSQKPWVSAPLKNFSCLRYRVTACLPVCLHAFQASRLTFWLCFSLRRQMERTTGVWFSSSSWVPRLGRFWLINLLKNKLTRYYCLNNTNSMDDSGSRIRFPPGAGNFSLHHRVQNGSGAHQPPIQWVRGTLSLGVKRPGREADQSSPSSAEVKEWVELYLHSLNTP